MDWLHYVIASVFVLWSFACVLLVAINLPGTWLMLAVAAVIELLDRFYLTAEPPVTFGWPAIGVCLALALVGEIVEFFAGAAGSRGGGGSRRGMVGAIVGGFLGAILFTPLIPILFLGTLIGALIGTFAGALVGEISGQHPRTICDSIRPASGATIGRILGAVSKVAIATVMWLTLSVAAFWPW